MHIPHVDCTRAMDQKDPDTQAWARRACAVRARYTYPLACPTTPSTAPPCVHSADVALMWVYVPATGESGWVPCPVAQALQWLDDAPAADGNGDGDAGGHPVCRGDGQVPTAFTPWPPQEDRVGSKPWGGGGRG